MSSDHWDGLPFLDVLRPEQGWHVEGAILSTYSLDMVALVAAMLALAGLDDDQGSGSKVDFANAYEQMREKLCVLVQAGRITWPKKLPSLMGILDRFIQEVHQDENQGSWHPKIALIKYGSESGENSKWRLWIGSRNLSQTMSWEAGLVLYSSIEGLGQKIPGIADLGMALAKMAGLKSLNADRVFRELQQITWQAPGDIQVESIQFLLPGSRRSYPDEPSGIHKLVVVSPFCDATTINELGGWGDEHTERYLLSTIPEIAKLNHRVGKPLVPFEMHLLILEAPEENEFLVGSAEISVDERESNDDEEMVERELHAKLLFAEHARGYTLWLGSANATRRGWLGPNYEIVAHLTVSQKIAEGFWAFLELAKPISLQELPEPKIEDSVEERLETARKEIVNRWKVSQGRQTGSVTLFAEQAPHPDDPEISLEVGLVTGEFLLWPRGALSIQLPIGSKARETELVQVRLTLGEIKIAWLQLAPLDPPPDKERDLRALAAHLSPRIFLLWLRSLLSVGEPLDGGGEWHANPQKNRHNDSIGINWWAPTLEDVLSSWTRNPDNLLLVDQKVQSYLKLMREETWEEISSYEWDLLEKFESTWRIIRNVLVERRG